MRVQVVTGCQMERPTSAMEREIRDTHRVLAASQAWERSNC